MNFSNFSLDENLVELSKSDERHILAIQIHHLKLLFCIKGMVGKSGCDGFL